MALAGCGFQPLYGGTTAGGAKLVEVMKAVDITPIPGRVGQKLRNELIFATTGGGDPAPTRYKLDIAIKESVTDQWCEITGDATGQDLSARRNVQAGRSVERQDRAARQGNCEGAYNASRKSSPIFARATMPRIAPPAP